MCEYQRISRQSRTASTPCQRKKDSAVNGRSGREEPFPALRKKYVWEEDTDRSAPIQMRGNKKTQQRGKQKQKPRQQEAQERRQREQQRRRPQPLEEPGNQGRIQRLIAKKYYNLHAKPWNVDVPLDGGMIERTFSRDMEDNPVKSIVFDSDNILLAIRMDQYAALAGIDLARDLSGLEIIWDQKAVKGETVLVEEFEWLKDIIDNGLCGGWSALHRINPERFSEVWTALADWDGEDDIARHMNRYCIEPETGWEDYLVSLADSSVGIMGELEPDAGYKMLPDGVARGLSDFDIDKAFTEPNKKRSVHVEASGAGADIYSSIVREPLLKNKKGDPHIVHIETDRHHMSVRTRYINREVCIEEIVESEYAGVVERPDRRRAEFVLEHGVYLDGSEDDIPQPQTVTLEFYNAV